MSPRGRPRKHNPKIPPHIDQESLPAGIYFNPIGSGRWYILVDGKKRYVAGREAKLSELHRIVEDDGQQAVQTVRWLCTSYLESSKARALAESTQRDYAYCAKVIYDYRLKDGSCLGDVRAEALTRPVLQRLVDSLAKGTQRDAQGALISTPSKAAHVGRFLGVVTRWGENRGFCRPSIGDRLELPREKADPKMPAPTDHDALIAFARERGAGTRGKRGSVANYLWAVAEIAYLCRLRGIEVCDMTEARATAEGLLCERRKGSRATLTAWSPRLRAAWDYLIAQRNHTWERRKRPVPLRAEDRPLLVSQSGDRLARRALTLAWARLMTVAIDEGVLSQAQRFTLHGLKHRGVTDTEGHIAEKQTASGHKSQAMVHRYDHAVPTVPVAGNTLGKIPKQTPEK